MLNSGYEINIGRNQEVNIFISHSISDKELTIFQKNMITCLNDSKVNIIEEFQEDKKSNNNIASYSADTFIPLVSHIAENIQNPKNIISDYWVRGGMSSRVITNNIDYIKSCGLKK